MSHLLGALPHVSMCARHLPAVGASRAGESLHLAERGWSVGMATGGEKEGRFVGASCSAALLQQADGERPSEHLLHHYRACHGRRHLPSGSLGAALYLAAAYPAAGRTP